MDGADAQQRHRDRRCRNLRAMRRRSGGRRTTARDRRTAGRRAAAGRRGAARSRSRPSSRRRPTHCRRPSSRRRRCSTGPTSRRSRTARRNASKAALCTFTITITNLGPAIWAGPLMELDTLPPGATLVGYAPQPEWQCNQALGSPFVDCYHDFITLHPGQAVQLTIDVLLPVGLAGVVENCIEDTFLPSNDPLDPAVILAIERVLNACGYHVGPIDGVLDIVTQNAIAMLQADSGLPVDRHSGRDHHREPVPGRGRRRHQSRQRSRLPSGHHHAAAAAAACRATRHRGAQVAADRPNACPTVCARSRSCSSTADRCRGPDVRRSSTPASGRNPRIVLAAVDLHAGGRPGTCRHPLELTLAPGEIRQVTITVEDAAGLESRHAELRRYPVAAGHARSQSGQRPPVHPGPGGAAADAGHRDAEDAAWVHPAWPARIAASSCGSPTAVPARGPAGRR